jgi:hypothetical protein
VSGDLIDLPVVLEHLRAVVAEHGAGYVYPEATCDYLYDGAPSCIVGHVLARLDMLDQGVVEDNDSAAWLGGFTESALAALTVAQEIQDGCYHRDTGRVVRATWGEALAAAEAVAE